MPPPKNRILEGLPSWDPLGDRDRRAMVAWVNHHLDIILSEQARVFSSQEVVEKYEAYLAEEQSSLEGTRKNLRKPHLTMKEFHELRQQKPGRGRPRMSPYDRLDSVGMASQDIDRIRALWKEHYGRRNRAHSPTAEEIAAERWGVKLEALLSLRRRSARRRPDLLIRRA